MRCAARGERAFVRIRACASVHAPAPRHPPRTPPSPSYSARPTSAAPGAAPPPFCRHRSPCCRGNTAATHRPHAAAGRTAAGDAGAQQQRARRGGCDSCARLASRSASTRTRTAGGRLAEGAGMQGAAPPVTPSAWQGHAAEHLAHRARRVRPVGAGSVCGLSRHAARVRASPLLCGADRSRAAAVRRDGRHAAAVIGM